MVVAIAAVGHHRHAQTFRHLLHLGKQLALAVVAAVRLVGLIRGDGHFPGGDDLVTDADLPGHFARSSNSPTARLALWPVTATARSPRANWAALASTVLSNPPENATAQLP